MILVIYFSKDLQCEKYGTFFSKLRACQTQQPQASNHLSHAITPQDYPTVLIMLVELDGCFDKVKHGRGTRIF